MKISFALPFWLARLLGQAAVGKRVTVDGERRRIAAITGRIITLDEPLRDGTTEVVAL